jgi:hypothetical protein
MKTWIHVAVGPAVAVLLWAGVALGQGKPEGCGKGAAPASVEGQVVKIDPDKGKVTVRASDGTTHEFQASKETLQDLKVGEQLKATLRSAPACDK